MDMKTAPISLLKNPKKTKRPSTSLITPSSVWPATFTAAILVTKVQATVTNEHIAMKYPTAWALFRSNLGANQNDRQR